MDDNSDIGLWLLNESFSFALYIGMILAIFSISGKIPSSMDLFITSHIG